MAIRTEIVDVISADDAKFFAFFDNDKNLVYWNAVASVGEVVKFGSGRFEKGCEISIVKAQRSAASLVGDILKIHPASRITLHKFINLLWRTKAITNEEKENIIDRESEHKIEMDQEKFKKGRLSFIQRLQSEMP